MTTATAVDALAATWRSALTIAGLTDVRVFDGPDANRQMAGKAVTVAAAFEDDQDSVSVTREERGARPTVTEVVDVACSVYVGSGEVDVDAHRANAGVILSVLEASLAANRTLGGVVNLARVASTQWMQGRDQKGAGVAVGLVVNMRRLL